MDDLFDECQVYRLRCLKIVRLPKDESHFRVKLLQLQTKQFQMFDEDIAPLFSQKRSPIPAMVCEEVQCHIPLRKRLVSDVEQGLKTTRAQFYHLKMMLYYSCQRKASRFRQQCPCT